MGIIMNRMLKNERLKRLLYYTTKDALKRPNLTEEESLSLIGKNIKMVPKLYIDKELLNYVIVRFDNFLPSDNTEFRMNTIEFDIVCNYSQWQLQDFALRPYKIAAEIDSMMDKTHLTGIGDIEFANATRIILNNEFGGICLRYVTYHGEEDKKYMPNPADEERFLQDFNDYLTE
jgi:hypothetical protein